MIDSDTNSQRCLPIPLCGEGDQTRSGLVMDVAWFVTGNDVSSAGMLLNVRVATCCTLPQCEESYSLERLCVGERDLRCGERESGNAVWGCHCSRSLMALRNATDLMFPWTE